MNYRLNFFKSATKEILIASIDEYYNYLQSNGVLNKFNQFFQNSIQEYYNYNNFKLVDSKGSSLSLILYIYKTPGSFDNGMPVIFGDLNKDVIVENEHHEKFKINLFEMSKKVGRLFLNKYNELELNNLKFKVNKTEKRLLMKVSL